MLGNWVLLLSRAKNKTFLELSTNWNDPRLKLKLRNEIYFMCTGSLFKARKGKKYQKLKKKWFKYENHQNKQFSLDEIVSEQLRRHHLKVTLKGDWRKYNFKEGIVFIKQKFLERQATALRKEAKVEKNWRK